jgi:hypothetical protein
VSPPTPQQLRAAYNCLRGGGGAAAAAPLADVQAACRAAGVSDATLAHAVEAGGFNAAREVPVLEVLTLMLSMGCGGPGGVLRGAFEVFGEAPAGGGSNGEGSCGSNGDAPRLEVPALLQLLGALGARDAAAGPALREAAAAALDGRVSVTLAGLAAVPALAAVLAGP